MINHSSTKLTLAAVMTGCVCAVLVSCQGGGGWTLSSEKSSRERQAQKEQSTQKAVYQKNAPLPGTIGEACYVEGFKPIFVQGYGLVVGLHGTGSRECPEQLRKDLIEEVAKYQKIYGRPGEIPSVGAGAIIDSPDTAVVRVSGNIEAGSLKGDRFDLQIQALPNTSTTSLEGGRLYTTDLRVYAGSFSGQISKTKVMALGSGAVFINPFEKKQFRGSILLRRNGSVLGGGVNLEDRRLHLCLYQPSYAQARAIEQKINAIFGPPAEDPLWQTAKAVSAERIELHVPPDYHNQLNHFLCLVRNLYVRSDPSYLETQANELTRQIVDPLANADAIAFAWEGMGKTVLPMIQPLYTSPNKQAAYYAAQAGARLGDTVAMEQLGIYAMDPKSKYQKAAIETLGFCRSLTARKILRKVLNDSDMNLRVLAYQGLARWQDSSIERRYVGDDNLILDTVTSQAWPMVYATRSTLPKIVIFGRLQLDPPVFYCHPDNSIIITAAAKAKKLSLVRKTPSGASSGRIETSLELTPLVELLGNEARVDKKGKATGLALPYSHIVAIMSQLCKDGAVPARFKLQDIVPVPDASEDIMGRPEKD